MTAVLDETDRRIVNELQSGLPVCRRPYAAAGRRLGLSEAELIARIERLLAGGVLSRFGPLFDAEKLGGAVTLAAMSVPEADFDAVARRVNAHPEVAHNYARRHALNMWFVVSSDRPERIGDVLAAIETETGLQVQDMPKLEEYFVGPRFEA